MLETIKKYALDNNVPIISDEVKLFLKNYIKNNKITNILEVGSAIGYSALCMANVSNDISITTIERNIDSYNLALENFEKYDINKQIKIINEDALKLDNIIFENTFDLIFIDGAKAQSKNFVEKYESLLNNNGTMIVDNIDFHGFVSGNRISNNRNTRQLVSKINKFIDWLENNEKYNAIYHNIGDGLYVIRKKNLDE